MKFDSFYKIIFVITYKLYENYDYEVRGLSWLTNLGYIE